MRKLLRRIVHPYTILSILVLYAVCTTYYTIIVLNDVFIFDSTYETGAQ